MFAYTADLDNFEKFWKMNFEAQSIQDEDFYVKDNLSNLKPKSILLKIICHKSMGFLDNILIESYP